MARKPRRKYQRLNVGEIYYVHYKHLVRPEGWNNYARNKGPAANNFRPVMVGVQRRGNHVQVSEITHQASSGQLSKHQRVRLSKTFPNQSSYINTDTISRSKLTRQKFAVGQPPLKHNVSARRVQRKDLNNYKRSRRLRGR